LFEVKDEWDGDEGNLLIESLKQWRDIVAGYQLPHLSNPKSTTHTTTNPCHNNVPVPHVKN